MITDIEELRAAENPKPLLPLMRKTIEVAEMQIKSLLKENSELKGSLERNENHTNDLTSTLHDYSRRVLELEKKLELLDFENKTLKESLEIRK